MNGTIDNREPMTTIDAPTSDPWENEDLDGKEITDAQLCVAAMDIAHGWDSEEDNISLDDKPVISRSDDGGAWVQAWIWVRYSFAAHAKEA